MYHPPFTPGLLPSSAYGHPGVLWGHCERLPLVRSYHGKPRAGRPSRAAHAAYVSTENVIAHKGAAAMAGKKPGPLAGSSQARHRGAQPWQGTGAEFSAAIGKKGGAAVKEMHGPEFYSEMGKKGSAATSRALESHLTRPLRAAPYRAVQASSCVRPVLRAAHLGRSTRAWPLPKPVHVGIIFMLPCARFCTACLRTASSFALSVTRGRWYHP